MTRLIRFARPVIAGFVLSTILAGCVVAQPRPPRVVYYDAPPAIVEQVPAPPAVGYNWVPGHYVWRGNEWVWSRGHYVAAAVPPMPAQVVETITVAPSPAHVWVRGHWYWAGAQWRWAGGSWVIRGRVG